MLNKPLVPTSRNIYSISLTGKRRSNEDKHFIITNIDNSKPEFKNIDLYGLFDGHGGAQVSSFLNEHLPKFFVNKQIEYPLNKKYVMTVYDHIQNTLKQQPFVKKCGSTALVVAQFRVNGEDYLNVINVGDSRLLLCRNNFAIALCLDHRPNYPAEFHRIQAVGGKITFDGFDYRIGDLSVSRAFGDIDATPFVTHVPDIFRYKLDKADKFMILACDGLFEKVDNQEVINFVLLNCYDSTTLNRINANVNIAKKLAEYAIEKGSGDNISVIVIFFR